MLVCGKLTFIICANTVTLKYQRCFKCSHVDW